MSKLLEILSYKKQEIENLESLEILEEKLDELLQIDSLPSTRAFVNTIQDADGPALIAEIKKASPSKGILRENFDPLRIAETYYQAGAHCLSILTDSKFFMGSYENLITISAEFPIPCLCKEFIIDPRQIYQARLSGADAILLIVAILKDQELEILGTIANQLGMDVLLEVHNESEMRRALNLDFELIGINNRDLNNFEVSLDTSSKLVSKFRYDLSGRTIIAESGINSRKDILILYNMGIKGFLVGESLLRQEDTKRAVELLLGY